MQSELGKCYGDYAELMVLQTSQLSTLVSDLDQQLKKFQLLPTKVQEAVVLRRLKLCQRYDVTSAIRIVDLTSSA